MKQAQHQLQADRQCSHLAVPSIPDSKEHNETQHSIRQLNHVWQFNIFPVSLLVISFQNYYGTNSIEHQGHYECCYVVILKITFYFRDWLHRFALKCKAEYLLELINYEMDEAKRDGWCAYL
jgi:hypothetical protein